MPFFAPIEEPKEEALFFAPVEDEAPQAPFFAPIEELAEPTAPFFAPIEADEKDTGSIAKEIIKGAPRGFRFLADVVGATLGEDDEPGKEGPSLRGFLKESEEVIAADPKTFAQLIAGGISEDVSRQISVFLAAGGKKQLLLPILAAGSGILKYRELKDEGIDTGTAVGLGTANALLEAAGEAPFLKYLFSKDIGGVKKWAAATAADILGEEFTEFSELGLDSVVLGKKFPGFWEALKRAGIVATTAFGSSSVLSLTAIGADKLGEIKTEKIKSEAEAELALAIDKAVPKPTPTLKPEVTAGGISDALTPTPKAIPIDIDTSGLTTEEDAAFARLSERQEELRKIRERIPVVAKKQFTPESEQEQIEGTRELEQLDSREDELVKEIEGIREDIGKGATQLEPKVDKLSFEKPSEVPLEVNQIEKMDLSEPAKLERAFREVLTKPKETTKGLKPFKQMVKEGVINEKEDIDINKMTDKLSFPHTLAKKSPEFNQIYERGNEFLEQREARLSRDAQAIEPYFALDTKSQAKVDTIKRMEHIERNKTSFNVETLQQVLTPAEFAGYESFTNTMVDKANQIADHLVKMGADEQQVAEFRTKLSPETYIPLSREGDHFTLVKDRNGELLHYEHHKTKALKEKKARILVAQGIGAVGTGVVKNTSDEVVKDIPVNLLTLIAKFDQNPEAGNLLDKGVGIELPRIYGELLSKGFPTHLIQAKNTPGFKTDLKQPVARYLESLSTWIERREARADMAQMLTQIDSKKEANLFGAAKRYTDFVTGNMAELSGFRKFLFMYYLGGNLKSALVNSFQNISTGWPVLSKYTNWSAPKMAKYGAIAAQPMSVLAKSDPNLADALRHGLFDGVLDAQHVNMLRGQGRKSLLPSEAEGWLTLFFSGAERYNRKTLFTAGYKEATTVGVKLPTGETKKGLLPFTKKRVKKRFVLNHEGAIKFAEDLVKEAHWNNTKADRPPIARGRIGAPSFTFRLFTANYLSLMKTLYNEAEFGALARILGASMLLGGVSAFPFAKDVEKVLEKMGFDPRTSLKELAGKWGDLLLHGLLFPFGPDFSGSISAVEMIPSEIDQGTWPAVASVVFGVPTDLPQRVSRAIYYLHELDDPYGAATAIAPEAVRNPMVAIRWTQQGVRTPRGTKVADVKLKDIILKMVSIQPSIVTKGWEKIHAERLLNERAKAASKNQMFLIARDLWQKKDVSARNRITEIVEHNNRMKEEGRIEELIIIDENQIDEALATMRYPGAGAYLKTPEKARQELLNIQAIHNQPQIGER